MDANEGTRRIQLLAKRIMLVGSLTGVALWVLMFVLRGGGGLAELFILIGAPLACGAILSVIVWIMEGFMTRSGQNG